MKKYDELEKHFSDLAEFTRAMLMTSSEALVEAKSETTVASCLRSLLDEPNGPDLRHTYTGPAKKDGV
jgi:hypothetical protein